MALGLSSCSNFVAMVSVKFTLLEICGSEDESCISIVENQYDPCHEKYINEWEKYMNASLSDDEYLLDDYLNKMMSCIVDENGNQYFYMPSSQI
jgi:hypothetical protein